MRQLLTAVLLVLALAPGVRAEDETCVVIERVVSTLDDVEFWIASKATTVAAVGCYCQGTCATTTAQFALSDRAGNAIALSGGGNLSCGTGTSASTFTNTDSGDADRDLVTGEGLRFSVTNSPASVDKVTLCVRYTY